MFWVDHPYTYIYINTHTHTHTQIYIYIYIYISISIYIYLYNIYNQPVYFFFQVGDQVASGAFELDKYM